MRKRMKRARDDDAIIAMGAHAGAATADDQRRRVACDVLLSLSSCGASSSSSTSIFSGGEDEAETAAAALTAPPPPPPLNDKLLPHRRRCGMEPFECRTCGRRFATFQALGGHRTSHLRRPPATRLRPKGVEVAVHACARCGLGFSTGQALGGHMRRHRRPATDEEQEDSGYLGLTQTIIVHEKPTNSASLQLLNLFV